MKILATTMGRYLQVFLNVHASIDKQHSVPAPAVFVADSQNFQNALQEFSGIERLSLLKEWEVVSKGAASKANFERIERYQKDIPTSLMNALLCDRRVFFGRLTKAKQDYRSHYSYAQLMGILDTFLVEIDAFIEQERPDIILSFGTTTVGDYLFEMFAQLRGIPFLQLKATKIGNRLLLNDTGTGLPSLLEKRLADPRPFADGIVEEAEAYIAKIKHAGMKYEGSILCSPQRMAKSLLKAPKALLSAARRDVLRFTTPIVKNDKHIPPQFATEWYNSVVHPVRTFLLGQSIPFIKPGELQNVGPYVFYPLHFEPEVSLQVFGKPFQNQIETIRNLALSVPAHMKVLVKEHPRSLGFRKKSYYKKLLDIPNVQLLEPFTPTIEVVKHAVAIAVVSGSVGLEAAICQKPVVVLGTANYELLPNSMVTRVGDVRSFDRTIHKMWKEYRYDHDSLVRFVCSIIEDSVAVNMYTGFLGKKARYSERDNRCLQNEYEKLASYVLEKCLLCLQN